MRIERQRQLIAEFQAKGFDVTRAATLLSCLLVNLRTLRRQQRREYVRAQIWSRLAAPHRCRRHDRPARLERLRAVQVMKRSGGCTIGVRRDRAVRLGHLAADRLVQTTTAPFALRSARSIHGARSGSRRPARAAGTARNARHCRRPTSCRSRSAAARRLRPGSVAAISLRQPVAGEEHGAIAVIETRQHGVVATKASASTAEHDAPGRKQCAAAARRARAAPSITSHTPRNSQSG